MEHRVMNLIIAAQCNDGEYHHKDDKAINLSFYYYELSDCYVAAIYSDDVLAHTKVVGSKEEAIEFLDKRHEQVKQLAALSKLTAQE